MLMEIVQVKEVVEDLVHLELFIRVKQYRVVDIFKNYSLSAIRYLHYSQ